jgi:hypothetical protein
MTNILQNRKADNLEARMAEFYSLRAGCGLQDIIHRSFEAGVAAENDRAFAESNGFEMQPEPVRVMDVQPGSMLSLLLKEGE